MPDTTPPTPAAPADPVTRLLERVSDAYVALDPEFRYVAVNAAAERSLGRPRSAILGRTLWEAFPAAVGSEVARQYRRVAAEGVEAHFTHHYVGDLDSHVEIDAYPTDDGPGTGRGVAVFWRDVTARVRAEEALGAANAALAARNAELQEQGLELELSNQQLQEQAAEMEAQAEELQATAAHLEEQIEAVEQARAALAENEQQLRMLADAIPTLAWTARADGHIDWYNARWYAYTGTTPADMAGWGWQSVHDEEMLPAVLERWRASIATGQPFEMTFPLRGVDGVFRPFLTRVAPVRDADGEVTRWFGTNTDLTAERAAAAERERLLAASEAARRGAEAERVRADAERARAEEANQAKSAFLANMSHELRTPLNAIGGYVQLLDMGLHGPVSDDQRHALARVQTAQRHLLALINDVLNYAKLEAGRVEYDVQAVDVREAVADVVPLVEPQLAARGLAFDVLLPEAPCLVWADREKLAQVLVNLLSNATKFTDPAHPATGAPGRVTVDVATRTAGPDGGHADAVFLRVTDTGRGIPRDKQEAIFEPFVQVRATYGQPHEGTGLGLAISRDLARGMGGELRVRSTLGEGSTFTLQLRRVVDADGHPTDRRSGDERRDEDARRTGADRREHPEGDDDRAAGAVADGAVAD